MTSLGHLLCSDTMDPGHTSTTDSSFDSPTRREATVVFGPSVRPNARKCRVRDCQKSAKRGGSCISHGGGNKCAVDGCTTSVVSRGLCVTHGGGKRCQTPACTKSAQSGRFCWVHGGGKKCGHHGCSKRAQSGGACIAHGGGKRCRLDGCNKVVQYDGRCVGHGGYRRCVFENCDSRAMANDYCQQHGGSSVCIRERCYKRAGRGGMCSEHKAEASVQVVTATSPSFDKSHDHRTCMIKYKPSQQTTAQRAPTAEWRNRMNLEDFTSDTSSSDPHGPTLHASRHFQTNDNPTCLLGYTTKTPNTRRCGVVLGLTALLNCDDKLSPFSTIATRFESIERNTRQQQHHDHHLGHKVYPVLPGIHAPHMFRKQSPHVENSVTTRSASTPITSKASDSDTMENLNRNSRGTSEEMEYHERREYIEDHPTRTLYMHSFPYRKNDDGVLPCTSTSNTHRHGCGST